MEENKLRFWMPIIGIIISIILLNKIDIKHTNHDIYSNLNNKATEEVKNATEIKNTYNISLEKDEKRTYYLVQIKGVFYTKDIENLSFKSNNIDIKTNIEYKDYKDKISTINDISIVDLTFKLDIQPTEITFNNKNIDETNISKDDLNKIKRKAQSDDVDTNELDQITKVSSSALWVIIDFHIYAGVWCLLIISAIDFMIQFILRVDGEE